jgi:hypothetical protein
MNRTISSMEAAPIQYLFEKRKRELTELINDLEFDQLKETSAFEQTKHEILEQILLEPIKFGDPVIVGDRSEARDLTFAQQLQGAKRNVMFITIRFPFEGSGELLEYYTSGLTTSPNSPRIYLPSDDNGVEFEVQATEKSAAMSEAKSKMEMTFSVANGNNPNVISWSNNMKSEIDSMLSNRRQQLINLYS